MNWIEQYVEYAKNNEAAPDLHFWTGLTVLGAALRRNVYLERAYYKIFPTLWTLVVAPSGTKKTVAVSIGYNILSKLDEYVRILPDKGSPEGLADALAERLQDGSIESQGLIYAPELANFMDKRSHNEGLVNFLLRLSDCPDKWSYRTRGQGLLNLRNVGVCFLGATANDLLYESIPALALKSGFLARFICVSQEPQTSVVPFLWKDPQLESEVINGLFRLSILQGEMKLPSKAKEWYIGWYWEHKAKIAQTSGSKLRAYLERKPDHLLRVALILSVAKHARLEYTIDAFEESAKRLDNLEDGLAVIYEEIDASPTGKDQMRILEQIKRAGGTMTHTELIRKNYAVMDSTKLHELVQVLLKGRMIVLKKGPKGGSIYSIPAKGE